MKNMILTLLISISSLVGLISCGHTVTKQDVGIAGGGVAGGVLGSAVTGGSTLGTVGGAVGGAFIGNQVAKNIH